METPLIWTSKGNLPIEDLRYETLWNNQDQYISFTENYYLDDELIKSSTHVYSKNPLELNLSQESF